VPPSGFPATILVPFSILPCMLHVPPIILLDLITPTKFYKEYKP
jgi:hypothetical protein